MISPCIGICSIRGGVCRGCGRTPEQIQGWQGMTDEERREVMNDIVEELKPCPFCGHKGATCPELDTAQGMKWGAIVCGCCGAKGPDVRTRYVIDDKFIKEAGEEWDKRGGI